MLRRLRRAFQFAPQLLEAVVRQRPRPILAEEGEDIRNECEVTAVDNVVEIVDGEADEGREVPGCQTRVSICTSVLVKQVN